jgi:hypothetical protein
MIAMMYGGNPKLKLIFALFNNAISCYVHIESVMNDKEHQWNGTDRVKTETFGGKPFRGSLCPP